MDKLNKIRRPTVRTSEMRRGRRIACRIKATLSLGNFEVGCTIEDVSKSGCRIRISGIEINPGERILIKIIGKDIRKQGIVIWTNFDEIGVSIIGEFGVEARQYFV